MAETIHGLFEAEVIHRRGSWRTFEAVGYVTRGWVDRYDHRRLPAPIGTVPPAEAEACSSTQVQAQVQKPALAACYRFRLRDSGEASR